MFTSDMVESTQEKVTISAVEPQVFGMLVNYAYTSEVSISAANVQVNYYHCKPYALSRMSATLVFNKKMFLFGLGPARSIKPVGFQGCSRGLL